MRMCYYVTIYYHMYICIYIYIYICSPCARSSWRGGGGAPSATPGPFGWHYLSNAACLMRPRLFSAAPLV